MSRLPRPDFPPPAGSRSGWPWTSASDAAAPIMPDRSAWPRITIVTPSFNQAEFIEETIRSVLLQRYPNLEYIIIDGGSTDGAVDVIRRYEPWLTYWTSERDRGQSDAINKGFARATGGIFAYLNSDDRLRPGCLARVAADFLAEPDVDWHSYPVQDFSGDDRRTLHVPPVISRGGRPVPPDQRPPSRRDEDQRLIEDLRAWIFGRVQLHQPGVFWTSECHRAVGGFDPTFQYCFDRLFFMRLIAASRRLRLHGGEPVADFRLHAASKTTTGGPVRGLNGFSLEADAIATIFEPRLPREDRRRSKAARLQRSLERLWWRRRTLAVSRPSIIADLLAIGVHEPAALQSRFYWGTLRAMLLTGGK